MTTNLPAVRMSAAAKPAGLDMIRRCRVQECGITFNASHGAGLRRAFCSDACASLPPDDWSPDAKGPCTKEAVVKRFDRALLSLVSGGAQYVSLSAQLADGRTIHRSTGERMPNVHCALATAGALFEEAVTLAGSDSPRDLMRVIALVRMVNTGKLSIAQLRVALKLAPAAPAGPHAAVRQTADTPLAAGGPGTVATGVTTAAADAAVLGAATEVGATAAEAAALAAAAAAAAGPAAIAAAAMADMAGDEGADDDDDGDNVVKEVFDTDDEMADDGGAGEAETDDSEADGEGQGRCGSGGDATSSASSSSYDDEDEDDDDEDEDDEGADDSGFVRRRKGAKKGKQGKKPSQGAKGQQPAGAKRSAKQPAQNEGRASAKAAKRGFHAAAGSGGGTEKRPRRASADAAIVLDEDGSGEECPPDDAAGSAGAGDAGAALALTALQQPPPIGLDNDDGASCWAISLAQCLASLPPVGAAASQYARWWIEQPKLALEKVTRLEAMAMLIAQARGLGKAVIGRNALASVFAKRIIPPSRTKQQDPLECVGLLIADAASAESSPSAHQAGSGGPLGRALVECASYLREVGTVHAAGCAEAPRRHSIRSQGFFAELPAGSSAPPLHAVPAEQCGTYASLVGELLAPGQLSSSDFANRVNAALRIDNGASSCPCNADVDPRPKVQKAVHYGKPAVLVMMAKREHASSEWPLSAPATLQLNALGTGIPGSRTSAARYQLVGIIFYRGGSSSNRRRDGSCGHYVARCLRAGSWWEFDDADASKLPVDADVNKWGAAVATCFFYTLAE